MAKDEKSSMSLAEVNAAAEIAQAANNSEILKLNSKLDGITSNQTWYRTIASVVGFILLSIVTWTFTEISGLKGKIAHDDAIITEMQEEVREHRNHPQFHANGFERTQNRLLSLRQAINEYHATKEQLESLEDRVNTHASKAQIAEIVRRIDALERITEAILEGIIEEQNGHVGFRLEGGGTLGGDPGIR